MHRERNCRKQQSILAATGNKTISRLWDCSHTVINKLRHKDITIKLKAKYYEGYHTLK